MENSTLSPASITQKVIALNTTMKEVCQKLLLENLDKSFGEKLEKKLAQINQFTDQLMNELSNYGDAVSSQINRDEDYEVMANAMMNSDNHDNSEVIKTDYEKLTGKLRDIYTNILSDKNELPASLRNILESQLAKIGE
ncbi:MAG: hypothetical protein ABI266_07885 [Ginsengibacter sp.]